MQSFRNGSSRRLSSLQACTVAKAMVSLVELPLVTIALGDVNVSVPCDDTLNQNKLGSSRPAICTDTDACDAVSVAVHR